MTLSPILTGRYRCWTPEDGWPLVTTVGRPSAKYHATFLDSRLFSAQALQEITPHDCLTAKNDRLRFEGMYRARLNGFRAEILGRLRRLQHRPEPVCVLCWCDLDKRWCHREIFAAWWTEQTGEQVRELAPLRHVQGSLL